MQLQNVTFAPVASTLQMAARSAPPVRVAHFPLMRARIARLVRLVVLLRLLQQIVPCVLVALNPRQTAANALRATQASIPLRVLTTHVSLAWLGPQVSLQDRANAPNVPVAGMLQVGVRSAPLARVALFRQRRAQIARLVRLVVLLRLRQQNVRCVPVASMLQAAIHNASLA